MKTIASFIICFLITQTVFCQFIEQYIEVDQFGYLPNEIKVAVLRNPQEGYNETENYTPGTSLELWDETNNTLVFTSIPEIWNNGVTHDQSGDTGWWFDFSTITTPGSYFILDPLTNFKSPTFKIEDDVYAEVLKTAGRMFFYNRCNASKAEPFAQGWTDGANFNNPLQDANCRFIEDPSNATLEKDLSGGWFDAGDYNKYVTFTHSTLHNLLSAYEENPQAFSDDWNIPESGNAIPDILDEIIWELNWLEKMMNDDGSVHIKMGSQNFSENTSSPPSANVDQRYYGPTCSSASITVASVFAHAAKVFVQIPALQAYGDTLKAKAILAYNYSKPFIDTNALELNCDDGSIVAGDADLSDDYQRAFFATAAIYLFELTNDEAFNTAFLSQFNQLEQISSNFWGPYLQEVNDALLLYTQLASASPSVSIEILNSITGAVTANNNGFYGFNTADLYRAFMPSWSYHWGSNSPKAAYGNLNTMVLNYEINPSNNIAYEQYVGEVIHYFHGVNPQGIVYLSNMYEYGASRSINEIYHSWFADGTDYDNALTSSIGPAPGFLSGGPNASFSVTSLTPPSGQPQQKSYLDFNDGFPNNSWEISEPAIYYQAAYIRLLANKVTTDFVLNSPSFVLENKFSLYPNPAQQSVSIVGAEEGDFIYIYSKEGRLVMKTQLPSSNQIDIEALSPGVYIVQLHHSNAGVKTQKLLIK